MDGLFHGKPYEKIPWIWGFSHIFGNTHIFSGAKMWNFGGCMMCMLLLSFYWLFVSRRRTAMLWHGASNLNLPKKWKISGWKPGDSSRDLTLSPNVGGHVSNPWRVTFSLTIPKRSRKRRIARKGWFASLIGTISRLNHYPPGFFQNSVVQHDSPKSEWFGDFFGGVPNGSLVAIYIICPE